MSKTKKQNKTKIKSDLAPAVGFDVRIVNRVRLESLFSELRISE